MVLPLPFGRGVLVCEQPDVALFADHMQIGFSVPMSGRLIEPSVVTRIVTEGEARV
jgi:hypothetical protein